ncbi:uncharacterized protein LOC110835378 isoform X2 [Zootermopsis nevadensis]|uniref:uncharacterized protein LOC110835378 isoform X2 n=1 Tax=Zootermopsis nevadensis TaxID=136037 RepID=UPI000B8E51D2|nr:uncharacterized protein LOC110835378 isoform X2 [Zootermopsis nevadensis]
MLIKCLLLALLAIIATRALSLPQEDDSDMVYLSSPIIMVREKRSAYPGRAMMFHGYFGNGGHPYRNPATPHEGYDRHNGRSYDPQGTMTAFASGDTVSTGSAYYGNRGGSDCRHCNGAKKPDDANGNKKKGNGHVNGNGNRHSINGNGFHQHEVPSDTPAPSNNPIDGNEEQKPVGGYDVGYPNDNGNGYFGDQPAAEETAKGESVPPSAPTFPAATEGPKKGPAADDSEEEEEDDEPLFFTRGKGKGRGRNQVPYYNSFFPIVFGAYPGYGVGRNRDPEDGDANSPGVVTAIANSFSTGRGAVATSHATAYGRPQFVPSGYRKNGSRGRPQ